ncbi:MAG: DUF420 domain-containing protein [Bacteroidetes bacterium]|jgi:putative membrane protein|nr:MAG: DUF420 domain-containing protein [Bacteroidota bacterium]
MNNEKNIKILIGLLTFIVLAAVVLLNRKVIAPPSEIPAFVYFLPLLNALLNSASFILLILSLWAIKNKKTELHKQLNLTAFILSALFLISYVTAHFYLPETIFGDANHNGILEEQEALEVKNIRPVYLFILITHIVLAALTFPLVLLAFYHGLNKNFVKHRKIVKWAYPLWLYVCLTGPLVYLFLREYYVR